MTGIIIIIVLMMLIAAIMGYSCCYISGTITDMERRKEYFELWVKACEEYGDKIYKLTDNTEIGHGVYQTIREYYPEGEYNTMRDVCYHLWWNCKHEAVSVGGNATELLRVFEERQKKERRK